MRNKNLGRILLFENIYVFSSVIENMLTFFVFKYYFILLISASVYAFASTYNWRMAIRDKSNPFICSTSNDILGQTIWVSITHCITWIVTTSSVFYQRLKLCHFFEYKIHAWTILSLSKMWSNLSISLNGFLFPISFPYCSVDYDIKLKW